ncbi:ABC transporter permease [Chitinophaga cymbidii]|uniref:ABC transporter permease n=1 Tax=Chitinophaga cymbidii TaxID=1096750 RepID=A0A512RQ34_9BACT|nr:ABC transporter permease [Chitinophaga cymbidii]GEP97802.1 ABC transporter permease [Chitinophaga cymbidii]
MLTNYLKTAFRNLARHRFYAAINILGLAFGLAACWLIVLYAADELSFDRYHRHADRIYRVVQHARWNNNDLHEAPTSAPFAPAMKAEFPEIQEAVRIVAEGDGIITYNDKKVHKKDIFFADPNVFNVFTWPFLYGDPATALASPNAIVLTETLARQLFGDPQKALDQTIFFSNNFPNKVTGVLQDIPPHSHLRFSALRSLPANYTGDWQQFGLYTYLLLKPGIRQADLEKKLPSFADKTIKKIMRIDDYKIELQPLTSIHLHSDLAFEISANGSISRIYMFIAIAALILMIAVINYMNLSTARASTRIREVGVRKAIGSGKRELTLLFITEALLITFVAAMAAILIVQLALPYFNYITGKELSMGRFGIAPTLLLIAAFAVLTGVVSGAYPALFLSRFSTIPALKGQMGGLSSNILLRKSLVVFQFVVTVVMIAGSIIIYQQLQYAMHKDLGFNKEQVLTFHIHDQEVRKQVSALKSRLLQHPAVEAVAVAGNPIGNNDIGGMGFRFETADGSFTTGSTIAQELLVDADYIPALQITMLQGRNFSTQADRYSAAIINETMMKKVGLKDAVGKRIQFRIGDTKETGERTIVGVIRDFHTYSIQHKVEPMVMMMPPVASMEDNLYLRLAKGRTAEGLAFVNKVYAQFDKANPAEFHFLDQNFARQYAMEEKQGKLALTFTVLAVLIACLGLLGLAIFTSEQRKKEIGVRKVLGAGVSDIAAMLSAEFLKLVMIAAVVALPVAWLVMDRWLQGFAYRVNIQWWVLALAGVAAAVIALVTVITQAVKAALANPVNSLRAE